MTLGIDLFVIKIVFGVTLTMLLMIALSYFLSPLVCRSNEYKLFKKTKGRIVSIVPIYIEWVEGKREFRIVNRKPKYNGKTIQEFRVLDCPSFDKVFTETTQDVNVESHYTIIVKHEKNVNKEEAL